MGAIESDWERLGAIGSRWKQARADGSGVGGAVRTCGFQSESKRMQVSAVWQLMPSPPARVLMRKTKRELPTMLNELMSTVRCTRLVEPSSRQYL